MRLRRRGRPSRPGSIGESRGPDSRIADLQHRLEHLEAAFEGLQDAVHRDAVRQNQELDELRRRTQPQEIARALSDSARERGI